MNHLAKIGMGFYISKGRTAIQAAAIIGGFIVESNLNTKALGDRNLKLKAHGIGQWRGDRWHALQHFAVVQAKDPFDYLLQLGFALYELGTSEKYAGDKLKKATTIEDAVEAMVDYERPAGWTRATPRAAKTYKQRLRIANSLLAEYPGT